MTAATVAQPSGNTFAVLLVTFIIVSFITVIGFFLHGRMWDSHERKLGTHADQLAGLDYRLESLLEFLGVEVPEPIEDDSPAALQVYGGLADLDKPDDDAPTDEFPAIPATVPSGIPVQVHGALIEQVPGPHRRDEGEMVERSVNIGGTVQTFRIRAHREDVAS